MKIEIKADVQFCIFFASSLDVYLFLIQSWGSKKRSFFQPVNHSSIGRV